MSATNLLTQKKVLTFAALVELATGLSLVVAPALVVELLLGARLTSPLFPVARVAGILMLALGLACWPGQSGTSAALQGMLLYNVLLPLYLAFLAIVRHAGGALLWPAVVLHGVVAVLLLRTWRHQRPTGG